MPGVAQVWLTQPELDALLRAAGSTNTRVSDRLWENMAPKLKEARDSLGCPVAWEKADPLSDPASGQGANGRPGLTVDGHRLIRVNPEKEGDGS